MQETIQERIAQIEHRIHTACTQANRQRSELTLLAISKTHPLTKIREALDYGLTHFGESYVQELCDKQDFFAQSSPPDTGLHWHFVGHLQRNKCKYLAGRTCLIHSVDSLALVRELEKRTPPHFRQAILLQFNLAQESTKSGFYCPEDALPILCPSKPWQNLSIEGFMTIPPPSDHPEDSRTYFRQIAEMRDVLRYQSGLPLPHLSMGMSDDLEIAIAEGATFIRIGTAIFGPRNSR
jgi:hypothetical protein